jgi:hypothetical protein
MAITADVTEAIQHQDSVTLQETFLDLCELVRQKCPKVEKEPMFSQLSDIFRISFDVEILRKILKKIANSVCEFYTFTILHLPLPEKVEKSQSSCTVY